MKYESIKNYLSSHSRIARKIQLVLFAVMRRIGLNEPLGLVQGVCYLKDPNTTAVVCEGVGVLKLLRDPDQLRLARKEPRAYDADHYNFVEIIDGHCLVTSGYFEVAILDRKRRLISELSPDTYPPQEHRALRQVPIRRAVVESLCVLVTPGARANYYHWMIDLMPAFRIVKSEQSLRHAALLINHSDQSYQRECLEALGLEVDVIDARPYTLYSSKHLYARELQDARKTTASPFFTIQDAHFLRALFNVQERDELVDLYVVRGHTRRRRIRNESEVIGLMDRLGFRIFDPSGHSVREQARQFASARKIVGFHGAGLTNMIFCGSKTRLIEILDRGYAPDPSDYMKIASQLGLEHFRIVHDGSSEHRLAGIAEDITVNVSTLEAELKAVI